MRTFIATVAACFVIVTGCRKPGEAARAAQEHDTAETKGRHVDIESDDGSTSHIRAAENGLTFSGKDKDGSTGSMTFGAGAKVPDGFPIAVISGLEVMTSSSSSDPQGQKTQLVMATGRKRHADVVTFYEAELKKLGLQNVQRSDASSSGDQTTLLLSDDGRGRSASLQISTLADGQSTVTLSVSGF